MATKTKKIKVIYTDPKGINLATDHGINLMAAAMGIKWTGQGIDLRTGVRDICFEERE